ncbi:MAG: 30S ribosomal protein S12 methylthiotransferase RimO [Thermodesulfovibrionales bacterium]|nr:30S ribosomal protein S12 methylthiotransferase RimO [Thermodesulfovibrionales bacterium]
MRNKLLHNKKPAEIHHTYGVSVITLGCPKNIADSRALKERLLKAGIEIVDSPAEASFIVINTCGFIEDAKKESIEEILKLSRLKKNGTELIAMGCLIKRYKKELERELPEVNAFFGLGEEERIVEYIKKKTVKSFCHARASIPQPFSPYAYIKISDGCRRRCTFCAIPGIKGRYKSVEPESILRESEKFISRGAKELILVGQEISSYGFDRPEFPSLKELIREISSLSGDFWIRLLYLHPASITDELLMEIASNKKVCKYLDIPLQHSEDKILRLMKRPGSKEAYKGLIKKIREIIPDVTIRTTFIVGFPGETEKDFRELLDFVKEIEFERLGAFKYSREEGTVAFHLKGQISEKIKQKRYDQLMKLQANISLKKNLLLVGKKFRCLVEDVQGSTGFGRLENQAPEIDGMVIIKGKNLKPGTFIDVTVKKAYDYDLEAEA